MVSRVFIPATLVAVALSACGAAYEISQSSSLRPLPGGGEYVWQSRIDNIYPADSAEAEATRMQVLGESLARNNACPAGYDITDRTVTMRRQALGDVFYTIQCR